MPNLAVIASQFVQQPAAQLSSIVFRGEKGRLA